MIGSAHVRPGRTARVMLLLATLFGLAAMHTLGHHGPHLSLGHHHRDHPAVMAEDAPATAAVMRAAAELTAPIRGGDRPSGWDLCVAVLVAFTVLLLAALLLRARRAAATPSRAGRSSPAQPRGPPVRRFGLSLATVSVLRI
ncbi:hypothetical protein Dvina_32240 [Dactylosporangium vinaceum]|uniref:DUF6153 family protein n=1 Tax=Dactylosporangium vinaceum TaxID=53362 RepID=A0ABV5MAI8_9ACTN|nr:DUF6153 family protein [Dactylosporangium vinaceum]UAB92962.1 hypothetical protein Dvina_32240 [Dactylosporangium vinaceum]